MPCRLLAAPFSAPSTAACQDFGERPTSSITLMVAMESSFSCRLVRSRPVEDAPVGNLTADGCRAPSSFPACIPGASVELRDFGAFGGGPGLGAILRGVPWPTQP